MFSDIDQKEIIDRITEEVLRDIDESKKVFTNEEIQEKIDRKLDEILNKQNSQSEKAERRKMNVMEDKLEKDFAKLDEEDDLSSLLEMKDRGESDAIRETKLGDGDTPANEEMPDLPKEKKKFFQEIADIYKTELKYSLNCFRNAIDSFKIMKNSSFVENFLIFLLLAIPAALGGAITLVVVAIILILWQLYILINVLIKWLKKAEDSIKGTINRIKRKIADMKINGGWFNRLIFSNALYSIIMLNGLLYVFIRGMMIPFRFAAELDRILANLAAKSIKAVTAILRAPSELALNNLKADAIKSSKVSGKGPAAASKKLRLANLARAPQLLRQQQQSLAKAAVASRTVGLKAEVAKGVAAKLQAAQTLAQNRLHNPVLGVNGNSIPTSVQLSNAQRTASTRSDLGSAIFSGVVNALGNRMGVDRSSVLEQILPSAGDFGGGPRHRGPETDRDMIQRDIRQEMGEKTDFVQRAETGLAEVGGDPKKIMQAYENGASFEDSLRAGIPNYDGLSQEQKDQAAVNFGNVRAGQDDVDDTKQFATWSKEHPEASYGDYLGYKVQEARDDLSTEQQEFADRHNGANCAELIDTEMRSRGMPKDHDLSPEEFLSVAQSIADRHPGENRAEFIKDLTEYHNTYLEKEQCKDELAAEQSRSAAKATERTTNFAAEEKARAANRSSGQMAIEV